MLSKTPRSRPSIHTFARKRMRLDQHVYCRRLPQGWVRSFPKSRMHLRGMTNEWHTRLEGNEDAASSSPV